MLLSSLIIIPIIGVIMIMKNSSNKEIRNIGLGVAIIDSLVAQLVWIKYDSNRLGFQLIENWGIVELGIDGISIFLVLLTTLLIPICILVSWEMKEIKGLIIAYLVLESLLIGVFTVLDVLFFYIAFESVLIPMYIIIGKWGSRERKIKAAYQFFMYTLVGSLLMLLGILVIWYEVGSTDYQILLTTTIAESRQKVLWLAFFISFAIKIPMIPFHIWLPEAHVEAPTGGSILLAGLLLKLGTYGLVRFSLPLFPEGSKYFTPLVYAISVTGIIYSSLTTLRQIDLKKIIAYSSVGHMNCCTLGIFSNHLNGLEGSIFLMLSHGVVSSGLFLLVGALYDRHKTRILKYYKGIAQIMPIYSIFLFILTLGNIGVPSTANYIGEFLLFSGSFIKNPLIVLLAATSMILSGGYGIWLYGRITGGSMRVRGELLEKGISTKGDIQSIEIKDLSRRETYSVLPLIFLTFFMGITPNVFLDAIHLSTSTLLY